MKRVIIFLQALLVIGSLFGQQRDYTAKWQNDYENYAQTIQGKNDPRVKWAKEVFERVKGVADKAEARFPDLHIIDSRAGIYARSVQDGGIIIDLDTLDICYLGSTREEGNRRLAFILGHELAHLANKDFIHQEFYYELMKQGDRKEQEELTRDFKLSDPAKIKTLREREVLADQKGMLYASMAGYDVGQLFREGNDFLTYWAQQTGISMLYDNPTESHPSLKNRLKFIREKMIAVVNRLELFRAGVLLFQVENYHDAAAAFREFAQYYPGREVLNNLGSCYLNLALDRLHKYFGDDYYRFRLSTAIDYTTTAVRMKARGEGDYLKKDKEIAGYIDKAVGCFEKAVDMDRGNWAASCNLAAALILRKEYAAALAVCKTFLLMDFQSLRHFWGPRATNVVDLRQDELSKSFLGVQGAIFQKSSLVADVLNNQAVAFYYHGKEEGIDTVPKAIQILESALQLEPGNPEVLYNLASIREERNRKAGAKKDWEKYLQLETIPKDNFYIYVYKKVKGEELFTLAAKARTPRIPGGIRLREDFSLIEKKWGKTYTRGFRIGVEEEAVREGWAIDLKVIEKKGVRVVAIGETIEIVEQEFTPGESILKITARYGMPQKKVHHTGGHFYVYQDRGFSVKEIGGQVCSYIWYEKGI